MENSVRFSNEWQLSGWNAPVRIEADLQGLEVIEGAIPDEMDGTLYRVGPDFQYPQMVVTPEIYFNGEGLAHMFRIKDGRADYRSRWVRNERFMAQQKARRSLFGRYRNRFTNDPSAADVNPTTANTHIVWHAGRLLVLKEDGLPIEVDPNTLETRGTWDCGGAIKAKWLTAHPKIDMKTNEMFTFAYQAKGDGTLDLAYYIIGADGSVDHELWFESPFACNVHDFAMTDEHIVFAFYPLITDPSVLPEGGPFYQWHKDKKSHYAVMPRRGTVADIRWFEGDACFSAHILNAFTEDGQVHVDLDLQPVGWQFFPNQDGTPHNPADGRAHLFRQTFDLSANNNRVQVKRLVEADIGCAMGRIDDRYQGQPYRHGYMLVRHPDEPHSPIERLAAHIDHATGKITSFDTGPDTCAQETCFVPRGPGAEEGDGWILVLINIEAESCSHLVILDARDFAAGPVARIKIPYRVRSTFHGMWVTADALRTGQHSV